VVVITQDYGRFFMKASKEETVLNVETSTTIEYKKFDWKKHPWADMVGPGWKKIVQPLVDYALKHNLPIYDVKEKWGTLRFYGSFDETLMSMMYKAEEKSAKTCEICGKRGALRPLSWIQCLCYEHYTNELARIYPEYSKMAESEQTKFARTLKPMRDF
jgi:hypothetical protein